MDTDTIIITCGPAFDLAKAAKLLRSNCRRYGIKKITVDFLLGELEAAKPGARIEIPVDMIPLVRGKNWR